MAKGKINVAVENIFPLIKKFLYSDHEIFLRELISNATDATTKLNHLSSIGEIKGDLGDKQIEIKIDNSKKTLHVIGESHSLVSHGLKIKNSKGIFSCKSSLIMGCKQFHLGDCNLNKYQFRFKNLLQTSFFKTELIFVTGISISFSILIKVSFLKPLDDWYSLIEFSTICMISGFLFLL